MHPLFYYLSLQLSRPLVDSPELARRREVLREFDRAERTRRARRRRERVRRAVALTSMRRHRELGSSSPAQLARALDDAAS